MKTLIVEDDFTSRLLLQELLKSYGPCHIAVNGKEAVEALSKPGGPAYDMVLMDIQMPEMNGLEAAMTIRNSRSPVINKSIPIIAMTANAMTGDRERCIESGMNDYVSKPINQKILFETLAKYRAANR